jgi:hypothetical protein
MSDDREEIDAMTRRLQAATLPVIEGGRPDVIMPAMIQVTLMLAMFLNGSNPREAADSIIATLEDAKRSGAH